jgi:hypothetical protein
VWDVESILSGQGVEAKDLKLEIEQRRDGV